MRFITFVIRNVMRRPARSLLTLSGMAVAVGAFVALVGIADGFARSFLELYLHRGVQLLVTGTGVDRLGSTIDEKFGDKLRACPK